MNLRTIQDWTFRMRGGIWTGLVLLILFLGKGGEGWILPGLLLVFLGQGIRFWAAGIIEGYRSEKVNAKTLVTWGPYGIVRNPLYLGNGLIGLGWSLLAGSVAVAFFLVSFLFLYCLLIIPYEEGFLEENFGRDYLEYKASTPRLFPFRGIRRKRLQGPFVVSRLWKSERHSLYVTVLGTILFLLKALGVF
ncbi:MAG: isoprenylcysteine carboxylmethyltransferase family protein [Synergistaceae bacterium]|nr:isoprenylcysteine carboxylmethyltransferase family protein [Synergistaceae bacterium]